MFLTCDRIVIDPNDFKYLHVVWTDDPETALQCLNGEGPEGDRGWAKIAFTEHHREQRLFWGIKLWRLTLHIPALEDSEKIIRLFPTKRLSDHESQPKPVASE